MPSTSEDDKGYRDRDYGLAVGQLARIIDAATPVDIDFDSEITPPESLMGRTYVRGVATQLIGEGGRGKTTLTILECVGMAVGKNLLTGEDLPRPLKIWLCTLDDLKDQTYAQIRAVVRKYDLDRSKVWDNLKLSFDQTERHLVYTSRGPVDPVIDHIVTELLDGFFDVLVVDPLMESHSGGEDSTQSQHDLVTVYKKIAARANVAVRVNHHTSKLINPYRKAQGRGYGSGEGVARHTTHLYPLPPTVCDREGKPRDSLFALHHGKSNLFAPTRDREFFEVISCDYEGGTDPKHTVGVAVPFTLKKKAAESGKRYPMSFNQLDVLEDFVNGPYSYGFTNEETCEYGFRTSPKTTKGTWIGEAVAAVLFNNAAPREWTKEELDTAAKVVKQLEKLKVLVPEPKDVPTGKRPDGTSSGTKKIDFYGKVHIPEDAEDWE
jgi:hypothetical protein